MEKIWLEQYQEGVPECIDPNAYASIVALFEQSVQRFRDRPAFENFGSAISFRQLDQFTRDAAAYFQSVLKLKRGERLAIILPNILQYPIVLFGALRAGLTVVNVNPLYTAKEMAHQLKDSGARVVVILESFLDPLAESLAEYESDYMIVTKMGDLFPFPKSFVIDWVTKYIKKKHAAATLPQAIPLKTVLKEGENQPFQSVELTGSDIAFLQYTGGTTGVSKGAVLTHRNLIANVEQVSAWIMGLIGKKQEIMITALPLYHIFCLLSNGLVCLRHGILNVLITDPRDIRGFVRLIKKTKFTCIIGVNTLFNALVHEPSFESVDFSALKFSLGAGMPVQEVVARHWERITGNPLIEGYGLTESSPVVTMQPLNIPEYIDSIGLPVPSTEIKIVKENGDEAEISEEGELWVRGPQVMQGYWQRPDETDRVLKGEWLLTGDVARIDARGFLKILERKKDMVLVSGFNVYPNEIEAVIAKIPEVLEVAVIGIPSEKTGEAVKAFIVKNNEGLTSEAVIQFCEKELARYKLPKVIEFRDDLPKSNVGKILRRSLR